MLSYSGTFVNQQYPYNPDSPLGCWEYHSGSKELIRNDSRRVKEDKLRVCLYNMEHDFGYDLPEESYHNWPLANHRMADALKVSLISQTCIYSQSNAMS